MSDQYRPLYRIANSEAVKALQARAALRQGDDVEGDLAPIEPVPSPAAPGVLPELVFAIDGSKTEVPFRNGFPGARIGYVTVAGVLLDLRKLEQLDQNRPIDPRDFRQTETEYSLEAAFPGCNVVTNGLPSARVALRHELYEFFRTRWLDDDDPVRLLDTYEALLVHKPTDQRPPACPYRESHDCDRHFPSPASRGHCPCSHRLPTYSTDALRIHDRFRDFGSNEEAFGLIAQVWERLLLVHLLRGLEKKGLLGLASKIAFLLDGPLGMFGPPAWLSTALRRELQRLNAECRAAGAGDLVILGIEKDGEFVAHFETIDATDAPGQFRFAPRSHQLLTDRYIKDRILPTGSQKRYGQDTYFGRKFFYKTAGGARIVASLPFLDEEQDTLDSDDAGLYPRFATYCALLDKLVSSRYANSLSPLVSAHSHVAIPLKLGGRVLRELARALVRSH